MKVLSKFELATIKRIYSSVKRFYTKAEPLQKLLESMENGQYVDDKLKEFEAQYEAKKAKFLQNVEELKLKEKSKAEAELQVLLNQISPLEEAAKAITGGVTSKDYLDSLNQEEVAQATIEAASANIEEAEEALNEEQSENLPF